MVKVRFTPGKLHGEIPIPTSKSHTIRSLLFALMAKGKSRIKHPLPSPDTTSMLAAVRAFGSRLDMDKDILSVEEMPDGLIIRQSKLQGSTDLQTHQDHRLAMALSIAAMGAHGESVVHGVECIGKSYPSFFQDFKTLGAEMEIG